MTIRSQVPQSPSNPAAEKYFPSGETARSITMNLSNLARAPSGTDDDQNGCVQSEAGSTDGIAVGVQLGRGVSVGSDVGESVSVWLKADRPADWVGVPSPVGSERDALTVMLREQPSTPRYRMHDTPAIHQGILLLTISSQEVLSLLSNSSGRAGCAAVFRVVELRILSALPRRGTPPRLPCTGRGLGMEIGCHESFLA